MDGVCVLVSMCSARFTFSPEIIKCVTLFLLTLKNRFHVWMRNFGSRDFCKIDAGDLAFPTEQRGTHWTDAIIETAPSGLIGDWEQQPGTWKSFQMWPSWWTSDLSRVTINACLTSEDWKFFKKWQQRPIIWFRPSAPLNNHNENI